MTGAPLDGWRVIVPRGGPWGESVAARLTKLGAVPVVAPLIEFAPPEDEAALEAAWLALGAGTYDWLVVTSTTTVGVIAEAGVQVPPATKVAAVGRVTAAAAASAGMNVALVPADESAAGLAEAWPRGAGSSVLVPQAELADPALVVALRARGLTVDPVIAYRTVGVAADPEVARAAKAGEVDAVLVTSGSIAREVARQFAPLGEGTVVACIGERTAREARDAGLRVAIVARERSAASLIDALATLGAPT